MAQPLVEFANNEPVEVALQYPGARIVKARSGERAMHSLAYPAGMVMFLDLDVSQRVERLAKPGERLFICKRGAGKLAKWDMWLATDAEKARAAREAGIAVNPDGRPAWGGNQRPAMSREQQARSATPFWSDKDVPSAPLPGWDDEVDAPKPAAPGRGVSASKTNLEAALKLAVAAAHAAGEYAKKIGYTMPQFTSEDLRCMAATLMGASNSGMEGGAR